jgi:CubicO group peptidase (beta-lactamase class C family)
VTLVAPGFGQVAEEFERNFAERGELGAAFAVYQDGEPVLDLWGGVADGATGRPWERDTLGLVFSGSKGFVAVCMLILLDRGLLDLEAPVARYWPEFAANGKSAIRVRDVAAHTARLAGLDTPVALDEVTDDRAMAALLAAQAPSADPRATFCYHPLTFGWLCGELVRRVTARSVGRFFAEEVAAPLELELWIGLPSELDERVARLELAETWPTSPHLLPATLASDPLDHAVWGNPNAFERETFPWNSAPFRTAEIPAVNAIGTARSIARLYGRLGRIVSPEALQLARAPLADAFDELHREHRRFGIGFQLQADERTLGPPAEAFGHAGAGGSCHGRWPEQGIGFSYVMNLMRDDADGDVRLRALLESLHRCVT